MAPYQVISRNGINYSIRFKTGKDIVVHQNNAKSCVLSSRKGISFCPAQRSWDFVVALEVPCLKAM